MKPKALLVSSEILALLGSLLAGLTLDYTNVTRPENLQALEDFTLVSLMAVPSTTTFTLRMNQQALQGMGVSISDDTGEDQNNTRRNTTFFSVLDEENETRSLPLEELPDVGGEENVEILKAVVNGHISGGFHLSPSDETFNDTLKLMYALRTRWFRNAHAPIPLVEPLNLSAVSSELRQSLSHVTEDEDVVATSRALHSPASPLHVASEHIDHMLKNVFSVGRNHETSALGKFTAMLYITEKFESYNLMVIHHVFSAAEYFFWFDNPLQGTNVIGVLGGKRWATPEDKPLVLGAHVDTVPGTPGMNDNGSGLAALVEIARVLSSSGCSFQNSIFFVAFDLEEIGTQGSMMFVKDYLVQSVVNKFGIKEITGAFILDCIANWDQGNGTQDFLETWADILPETRRSLEEHNYSGDFAGVIFRTQVDSHLAYRLAHYYQGLGQGQYRMELLGIRDLGPEMPQVTSLRGHFDFMRSDHVRFWYLNDTSFNYSIPAVLITDMGPYRGRMRECYHKECDKEMDAKEDLGLITKITQAIVWTVGELAEGTCGPKGKLTTEQLFAFMGREVRRQPSEGASLGSIQSAIELLNLLGLLPAA